VLTYEEANRGDLEILNKAHWAINKKAELERAANKRKGR
jgi:hypothetical protein